MTFSVGHFRNLADLGDRYLSIDRFSGELKPETEAQWEKNHRATARKDLSNEIRKAFVDSIKQKYPEIAEAFEKEIEPLLQKNGKPLKAWHVKWVLEEVDRLRDARGQERLARPMIEVTDDCEVLEGIGNGKQALPGQQLSSPAEQIDAIALILEMSKGADATLQSQELPVQLPDPPPPPPATPSPSPFSENRKGKERDLTKVPVADPPPQELWVDPKVQRQGGRREPLLSRNRAVRQRSAKGKQAEEGLPRVEAPAQRQYSAKELQRTEDALYKSFKAIERHANNGTTRLALEDQDKALANLLLAKNRPDCNSLDERIFELTDERTSLAIHWDLPQKMRSWVELILNATSRGDAEQIELEMRLHLEQLDKDVALLEKALAGKPVLRRTALNEALRQLKSMREQLESSEPWTRLGAHLQAMRDVLPPEPLPIKDPYIAEKRLEKLGISRKAGEDPVHLANEMVRAHNLLRDALRDPNSSWTSVMRPIRSKRGFWTSIAIVVSTISRRRSTVDPRGRRKSSSIAPS